MSKDRMFGVCVGVLLVGSLALNLVQAYRLGVPALRSSPRKPTGIGSGQMVRPLKVQDQFGTESVIRYDDVSYATVLYITSPSCGWCRRNEQDIKSLAQQVGSRYRFVGVSLSNRNLADYINNHGAGFPVYSVLSETAVSEYQLGITPQMILVDRSGKVVRTWTGAFVDQNRAEIERFFSVKLPEAPKEGS